MKFINYDVDDDVVTNYKQLVPFMPDQNFRMFIHMRSFRFWKNKSFTRYDFSIIVL